MVVTAPRTLVWNLLTDFEDYADWNPYIVRARGDARKGAGIELWLELDKRRAGEVRMRRARREGDAQAALAVPHLRDSGVLDREQTFHVLPLGPDRVQLVYDGRLEGLFQPFTDLDHLKQGYTRMTHALKERAERVG